MSIHHLKLKPHLFPTVGYHFSYRHSGDDSEDNLFEGVSFPDLRDSCIVAAAVRHYSVMLRHSSAGEKIVGIRQSRRSSV